MYQNILKNTLKHQLEEIKNLLKSFIAKLMRKVEKYKSKINKTTINTDQSDSFLNVVSIII